MKPEKRKKIIHIKSALPIYGAAGIFVLCALIFPIYRLWAIILAGALAAAGYFALDRLVFKGRDEEVIEEVYTGDKELDAQIKEGRAIIARFRAAAEQAGDASVAGYINRIADSCEGIIEEVVYDTADKSDTYTFFSYYMPTLDKLLTYYTQFGLSGKGENATRSRQRIEGCLKMVAEAFEKFQDKLYKNEAVEIKASIDVLKMMLRSDGLASKPDVENASGVDAEIDQISNQLQNEADMELRQITGTTH